jgi:hypothetical protein
MRRRSLLGLALVLALGCGSGKVAPVSGTVTLDGKALAGVTVTFSPIAEAKALEAGDSSMGKTDDKGHFTLETSKGKRGARVGKHRVIISRLQVEATADGDARRGGPPVAETLPSKFNTETTLTFEVPSGGTDKANFDLKSD